ncbi:T9SS type A sorting domain-containing protein [Lacinutrix sp. WUR7]|uniref:T9SS-dependent choice-of-anchor J family protein n=1 Tax=Lacinutrix sp. WUR7 TaxID=2653681 RepID=UPI00193D070A|nr:choice-of-anchor J domain-containing protein [Lacinutrix sp. WUR7]QRM90903.1 T9SS type A sorting domain-containing protein [Lacinutrix sp. WUR7]
MKKITLLLFAMFAFAWQANAQFTENFDTEIPATWTVTNVDAGNTWLHVTAENYLGDGHARISWDSNAHDDYLITPQFTVTAGASDRVSFWAAISNNWTETFEVRLSTTGFAPADFTTLLGSETATINVPNYAQYTYDLSSYDGMTVYVAIRATDTDKFYLHIDEFVNDAAPTCTTAVVNSATVMPDCSNAQFSVDVDVATVGDGANVTDGLGGTFPVVSGIVTAGPYATGVTVTLTLEHTDAACDFSLGDFSYDDCPTQVICGTPTNATGCYENNSNLDWLFASSDGTSGLKITVNSGTVENTYDEFIVYDGVDATAPELYNGYGTAGDLTGLTFNSTGTSLFVRIAGDSSNSCGSAEQTSIDFNVECLSCAPATVTATVVDDCAASGGFKIEVDITDLGSATSMTASDDQASASQTLNAAGMLTFGPYTNGTVVAITVANDQDPVCSSSFNGLVQDACPATNDECANAIDLDSVMNADEVTCTLTYTGSNLGATNSAGEVAPSSTCTNATSDPNPSDIWFTLTVPASGGFIYDSIVGPGYSSIVEVYTGTCGALTALDPVVCNSSLDEKIFEGLTPGDTVYLRYWDYGSNDEGALEFCIKPTPTCPEPTAGSATAITDSSADLGWTEGGTATTWNVEWGTAPLTMGTGTMITGTMTNPQALTGLTAETDYEYYVQADCGGGDTSSWSGPYAFSTTEVCPAPSAGSATAITETSADLGWTENGTATMWNIELVDVAGGGTVTGNATASGVTNPYAATGLVGDNSYAFYVQSDCGGGDTSAWSGPYTFATPYVAVIPSCTSGVFLDAGGASSDYPSGENVTYVIAPDVVGDAVTVTFTAFSSENNGTTGCWDGLTVYNGPDDTAATIDPPGGGTIWCWDRDDIIDQGTGDLQGMSITSTHASGTLTFVFTSDSSVTREGWEATVTCSTLSTQSFDNELAFTYYPNPVSSALVLKAQKDINNIAVYNMLGQEVLRTAPNAVNTEVNMSSLQAGAYFVKVTIGNTTETVRVIKN